MKDAELDGLLARGGLSGPTRDRVLASVLDQVAPPRASRFPRSAAVVLLPAAAGVLLLAGAGRLGTLLPRLAGENAAFEAKGAASNAVHVDAACVGGPMLACPRGSRLVFHVETDGRTGYLAAYADPVGGGERVWYFSADGESPRVQSGAVERAIVVGPEHASDHYMIHALVSSKPLTRTEAADAKRDTLLGTDSVELRLLP